MRLETLAVHAGAETDPETGAVAPPIHLSTTFPHGPAAAQQTPGAIGGTVVDASTSQPLSGANVTLVGTTWMGEFAQSGGLEPLPEDLVDPADFYEGAWGSTEVGGTSYGVPW